MTSRRSLVDGLKDTPAIDSKIEQEFIQNQSRKPPPHAPAKTTSAIPRVPVSTRMRTDLAEALKRASLQRQLEKVEPNTLTEILEAAVEPWLKSHGFLG